MKLSEKVALTAETQIGVHEEGGNNQGANILKYQQCTWLTPGPWAWCAAFVDWCVVNAMKSLSTKFTFKAPQTAGAWDLENWCHNVDNSAVLNKPHHGDIQRGDIVIFNFHHTGIALSSPHANGVFWTCEGNTNDSGSRDGDGVYKKTRNVSQVRSVIRFTV